MDIFLRLRHWMLFLLLFLPTLLYYGAQFGLQANAEEVGDIFQPIFEADNSPELLDKLLRAYAPYVGVYLLVYLVSEFVKVAWRYTVGARLYADRPAGMRMNFGLFKGASVVQLLLAVIVIGGALYLYEPTLDFIYSLAEGEEPSWVNDDEEALKLLIGISLFSLLFTLLYYGSAIIVSIFNGKAMVAVEQGQEPRGSDYVGSTLLWLIPWIGCWIHQPKINRYVRTGNLSGDGQVTAWGNKDGGVLDTRDQTGW